MKINLSGQIQKTRIKISKMDCPSEIQLIRSLFPDENKVKQLNFNLAAREVIFFHAVDTTYILDKLAKVNLNGLLIQSESIEEDKIEKDSSMLEKRTLKILLLINFSMFLFEIIFGYVSESAGLIADSLDMLADSLVYGISLYAVAKSLKAEQSAAFASGVFQMTLALACVFEVVRRFVYGSEPASSYMITISFVALIANTICLLLIYKHKDGGAHMKASWIFSANDVIANVGVLLAGVLVAVTGSRYPDLIIGAIIAIVVFRGALQILKISKQAGT